LVLHFEAGNGIYSSTQILRPGFVFSQSHRKSQTYKVAEWHAIFLKGWETRIMAFEIFKLIIAVNFGEQQFL
jgi:hypothetical protein